MRAKYLGSGNQRQPKEISDVLGSIIESVAIGVDVRHGNLVGEWEAVAPSDWASLGKPVGVRDQTLLVEVQDGAAASLLKYQIGDLKQAITDRFGADMVRSVRIKVVHS